MQAFVENWGRFRERGSGRRRGCLGASSPGGGVNRLGRGRKVSCQRLSHHAWDAVEPPCLGALGDKPVYRSVDCPLG